MLKRAREPSSADRFLFAGFLVLLFWAPIPRASNRPWAWAILEIAIFALAIFWLWSYARRRVWLTPVFLKTWPVLALFVVWLLFLAFQMVPLPFELVAKISPEAARMHALTAAFGSVPTSIPLSVDPYDTRVYWMKSIAYVLAFALSLLLVTTRDRLRAIAYTLIISGVSQAIYGGLMTMSGFEYGFFYKKDIYTGLGHATGTFVNRNHLAGYLEMTLAVGIGLLIANLRGGDGGWGATWRSRTRAFIRLLFSMKLVLRASLLAMVVTLVLTHSRMGNTAFFVSMVVAGVIGLVLSRHATRSTVILLASLVIIDVLIIGSYFGVDQVAKRIEETTLTSDGRPDVYKYALEQWRDYPWVGAGAGSFYVVFPRYRKGDVGVFYDHAHNDYLEFATDTGAIGLAILGSIVMLSLGAALIAQYRRRDPLMRGMGFSALMGITALLIHSTVDFNLQIPANALTFVMVLALAWLALYLDRDEQKIAQGR